jgi:hypothetical protein
MLNVNQRRLRVLQGVAALLMVATIGLFVIDGRPVLNAVLGGATMGGVTFIMTAIILLAYWGLKSSVDTTSG